MKVRGKAHRIVPPARLSDVVGITNAEPVDNSFYGSSLWCIRLMGIVHNSDGQPLFRVHLRLLQDGTAPGASDMRVIPLSFLLFMSSHISITTPGNDSARRLFPAITERRRTFVGSDLVYV